MTNIWTPGGGRVATMAPGPDDLFVVTAVSGRRALLHTVDQYGHALRLAEAAASTAPMPVTIRVMPLSLREAQALGFLPSEDLISDHAPAEEADNRNLVVHTCMDVLQNCNEAAPRAEALRLLKEMGVMG
ncbi:MAG: hypothetical protein U0934_00490 [Pseudotabrizicola sp.]|uniref:hypothetical protein n=1 Tax=Pseudotabrizicola sp. TaxID=2939647 RepID=UPI00273163F4|nr:hypothetical protein [Pseudotabrizicola sp.]MDP2083002.1 hypothetical protein [Pseudotabrizicola sp.]MDZ7572420.1 hypothetical protein [Pseudotabrizicola sp.]